MGYLINTKAHVFMPCSKCQCTAKANWCESCKHNSALIEQLRSEAIDLVGGLLPLTIIVEKGCHSNIVHPWALSEEGKLLAPIADVQSCQVFSDADDYTSFLMKVRAKDRKDHTDELLARQTAQRILKNKLLIQFLSKGT